MTLRLPAPQINDTVTSKPFWQWSSLSQYHVLIHDDAYFADTKRYLAPWIQNACFFHLPDIDLETRTKLCMHLTLDVEEVARTYLDSHMFNQGYSFATYFLTQFELRTSEVYDEDDEHEDDENDAI